LAKAEIHDDTACATGLDVSQVCGSASSFSSIDVVMILERAQATSRLKQLELSGEMTTLPAVVHLNRFLDKLKY